MKSDLFGPALKQLYGVEGELDLGVVLAEAPVHLPPRAQVEHHLLHLLPYVHLDVRGTLAEAVPCHSEILG